MISNLFPQNSEQSAIQEPEDSLTAEAQYHLLLKESQELANSLTAEAQYHLLEKRSESLQQLIHTGDPIQNILHVLKYTIAFNPNDPSRVPTALLQEKVITSKAVIFTTTELSAALMNTAYSPQARIKLLFILKDTPAYQAIEAKQDILIALLRLLPFALSTLNISSSQLANTINLPVKLLQQDSQQAILGSLENLHQHDPDGLCFTTTFFTTQLKNILKAKDGTYKNLEAICTFCIEKIKDQNEKLKFLVNIGLLGTLVTNATWIKYYIDLKEINWISITPLIPTDQLAALLEMLDLTEYFGDKNQDQAKKIMALPNTLEAMKTTRKIANIALVNYLRLMPSDIAKHHVWKAADFNLQFLKDNMVYIKDLNDINWKHARRLINRGDPLELNSCLDFLNLLPPKDQGKFFMAYCSDFDFEPNERLLNSVNIIALLGYGYAQPIGLHNIKAANSVVNYSLEKINHTCIAHAANAFWYRFIYHENLCKIELPKALNVENLRKKKWGETPYARLKELLPKNNNSAQTEYNKTSDQILNEVNQRLETIRPALKTNTQEVIDLILFIEVKIKDLISHYESQAGMFSIRSAANKPKVLALRDMFTLITLVYCRTPEQYFLLLDALETLEARQPRPSLSASSSSEAPAPSAPPAPFETYNTKNNNTLSTPQNPNQSITKEVAESSSTSSSSSEVNYWPTVPTGVLYPAVPTHEVVVAVAVVEDQDSSSSDNIPVATAYRLPQKMT